MNRREFDQLISADDISPVDRDRLHRVHELLLLAGPPPELTHTILQPPVEAHVIPFPILRRRPVVALVAAASIAAACFGGGYLLAGPGNGMKVASQSALQDIAGRANASLRVGSPEQSGSRPVELTVSGLPKQTNRAAYYLLLLWRDGKPVGVAGAFRVEKGQTTVRFEVPEKISHSTHWVVTALRPGQHYPGTVVMTSG